MPNLHSHAFQRAMAGLAEVRGPANDSFWSWRTVMYKFALSMTPDHVEAVAAKLYMEMLEAGFCRVGEFHYLHHDKDGSPYTNIAEMAERIGAASAETGIGLTLLPVLYAHSGFGRSASRRTACAPSRRRNYLSPLRLPMTAPSTFMSPSRSGRLRIASPGPAQDLSNGCSTMRRLISAGASSTQPI
jgi:hypothetical protein